MEGGDGGRQSWGGTGNGLGGMKGQMMVHIHSRECVSGLPKNAAQALCPCCGQMFYDNSSVQCSA